MTTISIEQAQSALPQMIENTSKGEQYTITNGTGSTATLVANSELETYKETLAILTNSELMQELRQAREQYNAGAVYTYDQVFSE